MSFGDEVDSEEIEGKKDEDLDNDDEFDDEIDGDYDD
jgi:hypothetical protein